MTALCITTSLSHHNYGDGDLRYPDSMTITFTPALVSRLATLVLARAFTTPDGSFEIDAPFNGEVRYTLEGEPWVPPQEAIDVGSDLSRFRVCTDGSQMVFFWPDLTTGDTDVVEDRWIPIKAVNGLAEAIDAAMPAALIEAQARLRTLPAACLDAQTRRIQVLEEAATNLWAFGSAMSIKHGMNGDDSMTDAEHQAWQQGSHAANACDLPLSQQAHALSQSAEETTEQRHTPAPRGA